MKNCSIETAYQEAMRAPVNQVFGSSVNVEERMAALKQMEVSMLEKVLKLDGVQGSVRKAAESRLRKLTRKEKNSGTEIRTERTAATSEV